MKETARGIVFGMQRFSIHDGPGIRTVVFLKGCNMNCAWCHNPESISGAPVLSCLENKCNLCGDCVQVCPQVHQIRDGRHSLSRSNCTACGRCARVCCTGALAIIGEETGADDVAREAARDKRYFEQSGGGLTISGGEPMCQSGFLKSICERAKDVGIGVAVETNGYAPFEEYQELFPYVDVFLVDYKLTNAQMHEEWTGVSNQNVCENLERFCKEKIPVILRCPLIPDVNDTEDHFRAIAQITKEYGNILGFEVMPYHRLGSAKAKKTGLKNSREFKVPDLKTVACWKEKIRSYGGRQYEA